MQMVTEGNQNYADKSIQKQVDKDAEHVMETSKKPIPDPPDKTFPDIITTPTENISNINPILPNPVTTNSSLQAKTGNNTIEIPAFSIAPTKQKNPKGHSELVPKHANTQLSKQNNNIEEETKEDIHGQDMDEEYTAQNFKHIARQDDLSPRVMDKVKLGRGRKKKQKENTSVLGNGVQTRRACSKSIV